MNTFRTIFLILVLIIQISGMLENPCYGSLQTERLEAQVCNGGKPEILSRSADCNNDVNVIKKDKSCGLNSTSGLKGHQLPEEVQQENSKGGRGIIKVKKAQEGNPPLKKKASLISYVRYIGTGNAELF